MKSVIDDVFDTLDIKNSKGFREDKNGDIMYAIRIEKDKKFAGYLSEGGGWWYLPHLRYAKLFKTSNYAEIRCDTINKGWNKNNITAQVVAIKLVPQRKDDE